jgi:hypothetical protein
MRRANSRPALRGGPLALLAATLFGVSTPLVQRFGVDVGAFTTHPGQVVMRKAALGAAPHVPDANHAHRH